MDVSNLYINEHGCIGIKSIRKLLNHPRVQKQLKALNRIKENHNRDIRHS